MHQVRDEFHSLLIALTRVNVKLLRGENMKMLSDISTGGKNK
jgi:hypothetical protein